MQVARPVLGILGRYYRPARYLQLALPVLEQVIPAFQLGTIILPGQSSGEWFFDLPGYVQYNHCTDKPANVVRAFGGGGICFHSERAYDKALNQPGNWIEPGLKPTYIKTIQIYGDVEFSGRHWWKTDDVNWYHLQDANAGPIIAVEDKASAVPLPVADPLAIPVRLPPPYSVIPARENVPGLFEAGNGLPGEPEPPGNPYHEASRGDPKPVNPGVPLPSRPPEGTKEKKTNSKLVGLLFSLWDAATEANDFVDAVFDALPEKVQKQYHARSVVEKAWFIGEHIDNLDLVAAFGNVVENAIEDRAIGKLLGAADKAGVGLGFNGVGYIKGNYL